VPSSLYITPASSRPGLSKTTSPQLSSRAIAMTSPLKFIATSMETRRRNKAIFQEYAELASIRNHFAFAAVPHTSKFPKTTQFLEIPNVKDLWSQGNMQAGVAELALRLDLEWPDWAVSRSIIFGSKFPNKYLLSSLAQTYSVLY
jgi:hypothetical protein